MATQEPFSDVGYPGEGVLAMLACEVRSALYDMRQAAKTGEPLASRELSCAITNVEQGLHWILALQEAKRPVENTANSG